MALRTLSLCSGIGGLDLGLKLALGRQVRTVCYVEREAYAAAILVARMEGSALDRAPIWDDIGTFPGAAWRGAVDLVVAGFPCQPWSVAGARKGTADDRWLWPIIARIIRQVGPSYVFLENVPGLLSGGGGAEVLGSLAALGFDAEWASVSAADVGAPHLRERVFIMAVSHGDLRRSARLANIARALATKAGRAEPRVGGGEREAMADAGRLGDDSDESISLVGSGRQTGARETRTEMADAEGGGALPSELGEQRRSAQSGGQTLADATRDLWLAPGDARHSAPHRGCVVGNTDKSGSQGRPGSVREGSDELAAWPPGPEEYDRWSDVLHGRPDLAPAVEPRVRGVADGVASRVDRLRALGNAVVPAQAAHAFRILWERIYRVT